MNRVLKVVMVFTTAILVAIVYVNQVIKVCKIGEAEQQLVARVSRNVEMDLLWICDKIFNDCNCVYSNESVVLATIVKFCYRDVLKCGLVH